MTHSGDEPQLGGVAGDNAPMISGVGARVFATLRGAYLAGNLSALIGAMSEEQGLRFKQAVVRQALRYVEPVLRVEAGPHLHAERKAIQAAYEWLETPTLDNASAAYQTLSESGVMRRRLHTQRGDDYRRSKGYGRYGRIEWMVMALAACVLNEVAVAPSFVVVDIVDRCLYFELRPEDEEPWDHFVEAAEEAKRAARQWQIEAAWAILHGKEPPPLDAEQEISA